jgi:hypothetical protein
MVYYMELAQHETYLSKVAKQYVFAVVKYRVVLYYLWWAVSLLYFTC